MSSAPDRRRSFARPSNRLLNLINERIRLHGQKRAAESLHTSVESMLTLRERGGITPEAIARLEQLAAEHVKSCACGRNYTRETWLKLPYLGIQRDEEGDLETCNCPCGSTIHVLVSDVRRQVAA